MISGGGGGGGTPRKVINIINIITCPLWESKSA